MNEQLTHFLTETKTALNSLDMQLLNNKPDCEKILANISKIQKSVQYIKTIIKMHKDLQENQK